MVASNINLLLLQPSFPPLEKTPAAYKNTVADFLKKVASSFATFIAAAISGADVRSAATLFLYNCIERNEVILFGEGALNPSSLYPILLTYDSQKSAAYAEAALKVASETASKGPQRSWGGGGGRGGGSEGAGGGSGGGGSDHKRSKDNSGNSKSTSTA